mmetsp:Transcript_5238/g.3683  ORF Transcript_5238/g.3683 Transcript_5238/m.3683 type:complete len:105 (-) Transcript_5238:95-409(-)
MTIFLLGEADDNEIMLSEVLDCINECFGKLFKHQIERSSLIQNMNSVILVIDEVIDQGVVLHNDPNVIYSRVKLNKKDAGPQAGNDSSSQGSSSFFSVFSSARS